MKLFQIEEPEGAPRAAEGPGVAVGIDIDETQGAAVAVAVGGNAELLPGLDGERHLPAPGLRRDGGTFDAEALCALLLQLRGRAEKQLARPVTHAVIAVARLDDASRRTLEAAAAAAGLAVLHLFARDAAALRATGAPAADAAVLGAALEAEDRVPPASP
ncbi:MAG TPA: Hsp70 family protein [Stellaceae bacterium]|nr:Hsp70 family protein [Stellaceae bacterium]